MTGSPARQLESRISRLTQRARRAIAVATFFGLPAMYAWSSLWLTTSVSNLIWGPVTFLLMGTTLVGSVVLYVFGRDRADLPGRGLDERQLQLRDRAWVLSYGVLASIVVATIVVAAILVMVLGREVRLDAQFVGAAALCIGVLLPVLPVAALAWIEPDAPREA